MVKKSSHCEDRRFLKQEKQRIAKLILGNPSISLTLTWCHRTPAETPSMPCSPAPAISDEHQLDDVACACYGSWNGVATVLLHQCCPVAVCDCQVVAGTGGTGLNVKCSELQGEDQSLLHFNCFCFLDIVRVVVGVVG